MASAELKLTKRHRTDYGRRYDGWVESETRKVPVTCRMPHQSDRITAAYVEATGLFAAKGSLRVPSREAVHAGHMALALDYTNKHFRGALDSDAHDIAAVTDAISPDLRKRIIGLSKGGRDALRALPLIESPVQAVTFVASAGFTGKDMTWLSGAHRLRGASEEVRDIFVSNPLNAGHFAVSCLKNVIGRPMAVLGEMNELRHDDERTTLAAVGSNPNAPYMRFSYGAEDGLFRAHELEEGIANLNNFFDDIYVYAGRHMCIAVKPEISREIYTRDNDLPDFKPGPLSELQQAA